MSDPIRPDPPSERDERLTGGQPPAFAPSEHSDEEDELLPTPEPRAILADCPSCGKELLEDNPRDDPYCPYCGVVPRSRLRAFPPKREIPLAAVDAPAAPGMSPSDQPPAGPGRTPAPGALMGR
jgi:hypothetical protein